ncbi:MAG: hypothetical protein LBU79_02195 [Planctomycetota bacterium]|nr:hypothetical protein [Planctomycetota bacterium]
MDNGKLVLVAAWLTLLAGCGEPPRETGTPFYPGERPGEVTLYQDIQFDDIPTPAEYVLVRDQTSSFQGSRFRYGVFHYQGALDRTAAVSFYRLEMPKSGWSQSGHDRGFDFVEMRFRKGPEQVILVIRSMPYGSRAELQLDNIEKNDLLLKGRLKEEEKTPGV